MAKASDLIGRSGSGGFQPQRPTINIQPPEKKEGEHDHSATKLRPVRESKPGKGGPGGGGGSTPTSVRPKV
jgi:hypothetical protein